MTSRAILFAAASAASAAALLSAAHAEAQEAAAPPQAVQEVIVTGTRGVPRSRLESLAPVDVVSAKALQQQGTTELGAALAVSVPGIDFPRPSNTDGTDSIRPLTLHGQSPDETLVPLNGEREHASALVNLNGSVGRGSAVAVRPAEHLQARTWDAEVQAGAPRRLVARQLERHGARDLLWRRPVARDRQQRQPRRPHRRPDPRRPGGTLHLPSRRPTGARGREPARHLSQADPARPRRHDRSAPWSSFSPFGFDGRRIYARLSATW